MQHELRLHVGPVRFRIGSQWAQPLDHMRRLYADFPNGDDGPPDFTVRLEAPRLMRRFIRPQVAIAGDFMLPDALPLPLAHGLLAAEMAMNLQVALGWRRHLLLHASVVERDGRALIMTGLSGSGKSTLSAMLGENGWRFMGDEFALIDPDSGMAVPFPRLVSLKNAAIDAMQARLPEHRFGPVLADTPKGMIRHLMPPQDAVKRMGEGALPALMLFPRYGFDPELRAVGKPEAFVRLTQASTNYVSMGEAGFAALSGLIDRVPVLAMDFNDGDAVMAQIDTLWRDALAAGR